jgi:hypothetical protein
MWENVEGSGYHNNVIWASEMREKSRILAWKAWIEGRRLQEEEQTLRDFAQKEG